MRDFDKWIATLTPIINDYAYFMDFDTVQKKSGLYREEINKLNKLVNENIYTVKDAARNLFKEDPQAIKAIPILLAIREDNIKVLDNDKNIKVYNFTDEGIRDTKIEEYISLMDKTKLFELITSVTTKNLYDYVLGVEAGLNSNARKNRGGKLMEELVEVYLKEIGVQYESQKSSTKIREDYGINLSEITKSVKRFDFTFLHNNILYAIETNFYASSGSKLNEVSRSYLEITRGSKSMQNFKFIWITDGVGWKSAKNNLRETFEELEHLYNINDLKNGALKRLIN